VRAEAQAANLVGLLAAGRENEDRHAPTLVAQRSQHAIPVHAGEHQIEDDQVGPAAACARQSLGAVLDDVDVVALDLEVVAQPVGEVGVVLDDEDPLHAVTPASAPAPSRSGAPSGACSASGMSGSSITKRAPRPGASSAHARPPCSPASSRTTERPIPVPATAEPRSRSRRQNRSQMRSRSAAGMPGPWSSTQTRARPSVTPTP